MHVKLSELVQCNITLIDTVCFLFSFVVYILGQLMINILMYDLQIGLFMCLYFTHIAGLHYYNLTSVNATDGELILNGNFIRYIRYKIELSNHIFPNSLFSNYVERFLITFNSIIIGKHNTVVCGGQTQPIFSSLQVAWWHS